MSGAGGLYISMNSKFRGSPELTDVVVTKIKLFPVIDELPARVCS